MEMLMKTLSSADPDVQKNTLEIIVQYLKDPKATIGQEFSFKPILQLISSEYPAIQNAACDILLVMTERRKNHNLKELFKTSGGVENLMSVLENFDLKDLHFKVLQIIGNLADTHDDFDSLTPSDIRRLITFITKTTDVADLENAWNSVIKLANTKEGRKVLKEYKILEKMMPMLKADNEKLVSTVCTGLIKFIQDYDTIEDIAEMNPIPALISLLKQEMHWSTKESAIYTIREAIKYNDAMLREVANPQIFVKIQQFTQIPINEIPAEVLKGALECLTLLAEMESFRKLLEPTTVLDIIRILEETLEDSVRVAALNFLNQLVHDKLFSSMMTEGPICIVWETITRNSLSVPTVTAAAHFIETSSRNNSTIAVAFIKCGALHWMLQKKDLKKSPTWKSAINVLLSNHLSAKFAYTARLEFTDVIKEQFYCRREGMSVEKQMAEKFPVYEEILQTADESMKPIYLVNIISDNVELKRKSNSGSIKSAGSKTAVMLPAEDRKNSSAKFSVSNSTISKNIKDEFLAKYIHQVKKLLEAEDQMKQTQNYIVI
ncbi:uncharacterized protein LOC142318258 isoform X2 [Lycorma delicatula]|uniref:uncharacterized protein LOC142318258 isoform X2 n=1 Tax=Lycorma delicatula TaxID=130591 RepID=UPI003F511621